MDQEKNCQRRRLAGENSFAVESCECGAIHLTIGFITLRMDRCAFRELAAMIQNGNERLKTDPSTEVTIH